MNNLQDVWFICYEYTFTEGTSTLFLFYDKDGEWDENKQTIQEAVINYPPSIFNWIHISEEGNG